MIIRKMPFRSRHFRHRMPLLFAAIAVCIFGSSGWSQEKQVDFSRQVLPILSNKCFVCHGPDSEKESDLRLDSLAGATTDLGGYSAVDPEHPEKSEILARIFSEDDPMPPEEFAKQLTPAEKQTLKRWIMQGGKYQKHWAFVPPKKIASDPDAKIAYGKVLRIPAKRAAKESHVQFELAKKIDSLISRQLIEKNLTLADEASSEILARRAALVLTGLPPEPQQLKPFTKNDSFDSYEALVDQLLASPRYGEHQARFWLDAIRYGDTHGLHLDNRRGIYPFRDWVVKAYNDNLPLDKFLEWQISGDLLPNPTLEQLVATGFVRMNPSTAEGGAIPAEFQAKNNFDRVETLGTALLGMSFNCARCHNHKYDPVSQNEYYRLLAFFNSTAEPAMDGNRYIYGPTILAPKNQAEWLRWDRLQKAREQLLNKADQVVQSSKVDDRKNWQAADEATRFKWIVEGNGPPRKLGLDVVAGVIDRDLNDLKKGFTTTLIAKDLPKPRTTRLLHRGEYDQPVGEPLSPGFISVLGEFPDIQPRNRKDLAKWLTSRQNPLVARVIVNQLWQRVFGVGLVRTPEDFGLQGQQPTHPELLDLLAVELQESGWDMKSMIKAMLLSQTFRQSSAFRKGIDDPENRLFARGPSYRLSAEVLRDISLWGSGLLDETMGGEGTKPYQPPGMWMALAHPGSNTKQYVPDSGPKIYRRSLYLYWKRTSPHPMMTLFDAPSRETSCVRRSRTNTALQSLGLFNETQRVETARVFAQRLVRERKADSERLDFLYLLTTSRKPTPQESEACFRLLSQMKKRYSAAPADANQLLTIGQAPVDGKLDRVEVASWTQVVNVVLASDAAILLY